MQMFLFLSRMVKLHHVIETESLGSVFCGILLFCRVLYIIKYHRFGTAFGIKIILNNKKKL